MPDNSRKTAPQSCYSSPVSHKPPVRHADCTRRCSLYYTLTVVNCFRTFFRLLVQYASMWFALVFPRPCARGHLYGTKMLMRQRDLGHRADDRAIVERALRHRALSSRSLVQINQSLAETLRAVANRAANTTAPRC